MSRGCPLLRRPDPVGHGGGGGFAAGEARTAMPLASVTFCAAARALAAITAAMSLMVAADRAPRD